VKKVLSIIAIAAAALVIVVATSFFAMIYLQDGKTVAKAKQVALLVNQFCRERGRLPEPDEFAGLFPELSNSRDWFYWPAPDQASVRIQYPMSSRHPGAPGSAKMSEFTGTTYAYNMLVECRR
jgi:hypothetical protein